MSPGKVNPSHLFVYKQFVYNTFLFHKRQQKHQHSRAEKEAKRAGGAGRRVRGGGARRAIRGGGGDLVGVWWGGSYKKNVAQGGESSGG